MVHSRPQQDLKNMGGGGGRGFVLIKLTLEIVCAQSWRLTNPWNQINAQFREELSIGPIFLF